ncbi:prepilin-type N-terminal cleavage/methylation domain-containing protein [Vibrio tapetis subsp. quintayensis]|uniref:prepilin-type N-terminal cleavage/methylation domain-containing protein n=1 Tax=Vibrio tapetis TaxID=52443 RepID=UPI0025B4B47C|nr:prepilin-type N-terminal cleavage/methylation domain-containing protein [Vibrio tapetis]MDN3680412.1 prepilin-type N-terminal cleavage/methylation domain-containing protein [Vibrio tapetis subsp. quintayensis]
MKKQSGFSLVELVVVIVILGLLAAAALPKFLNVTDEAKKASIEGVAGGYATGVLSARAQWEAKGRPGDGTGNAKQHWIEYDGVEFWLTRSFDNSGNESGFRDGYPIALKVSGETTAPTTLTSTACVDLMDNLLQNPPKVGDASDTDLKNLKYTAEANTSENPDNTCTYVQQEGSDHKFIYEVKTGRVTVELQ